MYLRPACQPALPPHQPGRSDSNRFVALHHKIASFVAHVTDQRSLVVPVQEYPLFGRAGNLALRDHDAPDGLRYTDAEHVGIG